MPAKPFKIEPTEDNGIFYLIGDKMHKPVAEEDAIDIESELDLDALESLDITEDDGVELEKFDFTL